MKNEKEAIEDILAIMVRIRTEFPELIKYIPEMPVKVLDSSNVGVTAESLIDYYSSLENLIQKYAMEQAEIAKKRNRS